ncbi:hypothetical protein N9D08_01555 [bacterium]|nr:hypothetical protein [bacterium]
MSNRSMRFDRAFTFRARPPLARVDRSSSVESSGRRARGRRARARVRGVARSRRPFDVRAVGRSVVLNPKP